jgi:hypothetical protein
LMAAGTYVLAEQPLRHRPGRAVPAALFAASIGLFLAGIAMMQGVIRPRLSDAFHSDISHAAVDWGYPHGLNRTTLPSGLVIYDNRTAGDHVLFAGDSIMEQYWPRIAHRIAQSGQQQSAVFAAIGACPAIPGVVRKSSNHCDPLGRNLADMAQKANVRAVVLTGLWNGYLINPDYIVIGQPVTADPIEHKIAAMVAFIEDLRRREKPVWIIRSMPIGGTYSPMKFVRRPLFDFDHVAPTGVARKTLDEIRSAGETRMIEAARNAGAKIIDPFEWMCDAVMCPATDATGRLIYRDASHIRASYVRTHASFIDETFLPADRRTSPP